MAMADVGASPHFSVQVRCTHVLHRCCDCSLLGAPRSHGCTLRRRYVFICHTLVTGPPTADDDIKVRIITTLPMRYTRCVIESLHLQGAPNTQKQRAHSLLVPFEQPDIRRLLPPR